MKDLLKWDMYEVRTTQSSIQGVKFRGRIRKHAIEHKQTLLTENASDEVNVVRFAVLAGEDATSIETYIKTIIPDVIIQRIREKIVNPVLSKLKVNSVERYEL